MDFHSKENHLLLNPKLKSEVRRSYEHAWTFALTKKKLESHIAMATSGTTSDAGKLVLLSKNAFLESAKSVNRHLETSQQDIWLKALPEFHVGGLSILARASLAGSKVFEYSDEKWNAQKFFEALVASRATLISLVPTQIFDLLNLDLRAPKNLRAVLIGGAALSETVYHKTQELGWKLLPSYGMTETCSMIACSDGQTHEPKVLSHAKVRLGEGGQLQVSASSLLTAYVLRQNETSYELVDPKYQDSESLSWFNTEDLAYVTDEHIQIIGRGDDFFKVGGEGVSLLRLENVLAQLKLEMKPNYDLVLLVVPDERLGSRADLLSTSKDISQVQRFVDHFNERVTGFERIRKIHLVNQIPRTDLGKVKRQEALSIIDA